MFGLNHSSITSDIVEMTSKHELNRERFCTLCFKYQKNHQKSKKISKIQHKIYNINLVHEDLIKKFNANYSYFDERWPKILCANCKYAVLESKNGIFRRTVPKFDYNLVLKRKLPSARQGNNINCSCFICMELDSMNMPANNFKLFRKKRPNKQNTTPICSKCFKKMVKKHKCRTLKRNLIMRVKEVVKEQHVEQALVSNLLKDINNSTHSNGQIMNRHLKLKNNKGKSSNIFVGKVPEKSKLRAKDVIKLQKRCGSKRNTKKILSHLRSLKYSTD